MCKILCIDRKNELKKNINKKSTKKKSPSTQLNETSSLHFNDFLDKCENNILNEDNLPANEDTLDNQNDLIYKREKSRIAAKKRRTQENENLSELYISLPVATQSKLLSCYDNQFIGNFEKATIIKISASVLHLYNSLSNILFDNSFQFDKSPLVSLFSQSIFGLFWCDNSSKLVFSSPGLARLTGLYWCNMIGMPRSSIIVESTKHKSSNMIFLRFMMGALKDKGIFTVNPPKSGNEKSSDDIKTEKGLSSTYQTKRDFIGKLPCSVWCSQKLFNGISFNLIQPLILKPPELPNENQIFPARHTWPYRLPILNSSPYFGKSRSSLTLTSYHYLDTLTTMSISGDFERTLGYNEENLSKSNLLSFFHCDDIVQISKQINQLLSGEKKIQMGIARLCTSKVDIYRWTRYVFQISNIKEAKETDFRNLRSNVSQGESYSQHFVQISNNLNNDNADFTKTDDNVQNSWLESSYFLCHYFKEYQLDYASELENERCMNTDYVNSNSFDLSTISNNQEFMSTSPSYVSEDSSCFYMTSTPVCKPAEIISNKPIFNHFNSSYYLPNYQPQESILLKELMRPINHCA